MRRTHLHGFTLIELLVVISIIALLIAVLLPALKHAKDAAKAVQCESDMKQIGVACVIYAKDNEGAMVPENIGGKPWWHFTEPYLSVHHQEYRGMRCPSFVLTDTRPGWQAYYTGYSFNGNFRHRKLWNLRDIPMPHSKVVYFWDDLQLGSAYGDSYDGGYPTGTWWNGGSWYRLAFRHNDNCHLAMLDGHVAVIKKRGYRNPGHNPGRLTAYDYSEYNWDPH